MTHFFLKVSQGHNHLVIFSNSTIDHFLFCTYLLNTFYMPGTVLELTIKFTVYSVCLEHSVPSAKGTN